MPLEGDSQGFLQGLDFIISLDGSFQRQEEVLVLPQEGWGTFGSCWCEDVKRGPWMKFPGAPGGCPAGAGLPSVAVLPRCSPSEQPGQLAACKRPLAGAWEGSSLFLQEMPRHAAVGNYFSAILHQGKFSHLLLAWGSWSFPQVMNKRVRAARFTRGIRGETALPRQEPQAGRMCSLLMLASFRWKKNDPVLLFCYNISVDGLMFALKNVKKPGGRSAEWQEMEYGNSSSFNWLFLTPSLVVSCFLLGGNAK